MKAEKSFGNIIPDSVDRQVSFSARQGIEEKLWLCLYFPNLVLEVLSLPEPELQPYVVYKETGGQSMIIDVSLAAYSAGVEPGMAVGAATVLCPALITVPRKKKLEKKLLRSVASWLNQYSPEISSAETSPKKTLPKNTLLVEIGSSARLFGGISPLLYIIGSGLNKNFSLTSKSAVAPTPVASYLLAKNIDLYLAESKSKNEVLVIKDRSSLRSILGKLSITDSGLADKAVKQLYSSGVKVLFDMWRLPRAGLARRFGVELLDWMDRVLGFEQDIQVYYRAPETFVKELSLLQEVTTTEELKPVIYKLLNYMIRFLREQDAGVESFSICLKHEGDKISANTIRLASVTRDKERIKLLINEKLGSIRLSQPVLGVGLQATEILAFKAETSDLFAFSTASCQSRVDHQSWTQLIEQLQNRLGLNAVQFIDVVSDYRPEKAWCYRKKKPLKSKNLLPLLQRPLWLLSMPQLLKSCDGCLYYKSNILTLVKGERIESGWWDGNDIRRDYYVARDNFGAQYWVYRNLNSKTEAARWFLHGVFS